MAKRRYDKIVSQSQLEFLHDLYSKGIPIGDDELQLLKDKGFIKEEEKENYFFKESKSYTRYDNRLKVKLPSEQEVDSRVEILEDDGLQLEGVGVSFDDQRVRIVESARIIDDDEWKPRSTTEHTQDFIDWINSINSGFANRRQYKKFNLYRQQCNQWTSENSSPSTADTQEERQDLEDIEIDRCARNTLYFCNKYGRLKEGAMLSGIREYEGTPCHEIVIYLIDCGYSLEIIKPRQIAMTSTIGLVALKRTVFVRNHFIKFVTENDMKGKEIFSDKIVYPFSELQEWMRPKASNDREKLFKLGFAEKKGEKEGVQSKIEVSAPTKTVISGGSPTLSIIDEAGNIPILQEIIQDAKPTMYWMNPATKRIELKRQILIFGCVCAGTKVWTANGKLVNIEDLKQEDGIIGYDGKGISKEPITWMKPPAEKPCYRITTTGGDYLECSEDHPLMMGKKEWKTSYNRRLLKFERAENIKEGDYLMMTGSVPLFGKKQIKYARLLGLLIGDGNYSKDSTPQMSVAEEEIDKYLDDNYDTVTCASKVLKNGGKFRTVSIRGFMDTLRKHQMMGQSKDNKRLPFDIDDFDKRSVADLLAGYFDADGNVYYNESKNVIRIVLTSVVKELLVQVKYQLIKFGIGCSIHLEKRAEGSKKISKGQKDYIYRLYINNQSDVLKFKKHIKLLCKHKKIVLDAISNLSSSKKHYGQVKIGEFVLGENGKGKHFVGNKNMTNLKFKKVVKVEFIGDRPIYNLTAGATHTYLANGFVTANTGGEVEKGGKAFESVFMTTMAMWKKNDFSQGIIPLFFDWTTRPGITQEFYDNQKAIAYATEGPKAKEARVLFHQQYPSTVEDAFMTTAKTLVDMEYIEGALKRIQLAFNKNKSLARPRLGYFEPIFGNKLQSEASDVPYDIIGANFIPTEDNDPRATSCIFVEPDAMWEHRFYAGTDPIASDNGTSRMSTAIWDKQFQTLAGYVFYRDQDYKFVFLQCLLMGIYYDTKYHKGVKDVLEANTGLAYREYKDNHGFYDSLVFNTELPQYLQTSSGNLIGIDNHGNRNKLIIDKMFEMIQAYGGNIYMEEFFSQLKTFTCSISKTGKTEAWGPVDKRYYHDDLLFSSTFAYICSLCYPTPPRKRDDKSAPVKIRYEIVRQKDLTLTRVPRRVK